MEKCECIGWKKTENVSASISFGDTCRCEHMLGKRNIRLTKHFSNVASFGVAFELFVINFNKFLLIFLESHISHLRTKSEQELNRLLSMVVDVDNMCIAMNREENMDTKKPYSYLLKVFLKLFIFVIYYIWVL